MKFMQQENFSRDVLVSELGTAGAKIKGSTVQCPFHDDRTPSGQIYQGEDGHFRYKCHAAACGFCGDVFDIRAKLTGQPVADVLRETKQSRNSPKPHIYQTIDEIKSMVNGTVEDVYPYTNPQTRKPDLIILRTKQNNKKSFLQASPVDGGFVLKAPPKPWPLFNRIQLETSNEVVVVEGEKCVKELRKAGFTGTTSPGGAGKAEHADWNLLAGKKVFIWPDKDIVGINHGKQVVEILSSFEPAPTVFWIDPAKYPLPENGDVVDFLKSFDLSLHREAIECVLRDAEPLNAAQQLDNWFEDVIAGKIEAIVWPWPLVGNLTQALIPETVTLLCGCPGAGKSLFLLQALQYWCKYDVKVCIFELEKDKRFHLNRALAQHVENSNLCDLEWIQNNADQVRRIKSESGNITFLRNFESCIYAAPDKNVDFNWLLDWVEGRAKAGFRIIIIDPVSIIAATERDVWIADGRFVLSLRTLAKKYKASIILVTHPKKSNRGQAVCVNLNELAGGASYQRFTDTVLWLQSYPAGKEVKVKTPIGTSTCEINRAIRVLKANNGRGNGTGVAFKFYPESLTFGEQGIIIPETKKKD